MRRALLLGVLGAGLAGLVAAAAFFGRSTAAPQPPPPPPARNAPVFQEHLDGRRYVNRDLGVSVTGPEGWTGSLGDRSQDRQPYWHSAGGVGHF